MANALQLITAITEAVDPQAVMQRITERTLELIEPARGVMIGLADEGGVVYVTGAGNQRDFIGTRVSYASSLTGLALRTGYVQRSDDTELDPRVDREACRRHLVRSLLCVPLQRDDDTVGVLAVNCPVPHAFHDDHVDTLRRLADFVCVAITSARDLHVVSTELLDSARRVRGPVAPTEEMGPAGSAESRYVMGVLSPDAASRLESRERVEAVLDSPELLSIVFQPVVDLATDEVLAVEALARFASDPYRSPDEWFAAAHACGMGVDLELRALRLALRQVDDLPDGVAMTVNVGPHAARSPGFADAFRDVPSDRVILEITEHAVVDDYPRLIAALRDLRRGGIRLAVDDTGSGFSSLAHILKMAPDFIKLDLELTRGIDLDPVRRAMAASLVSFAADTGAQIVAEGVESADELAVLGRLGVRYAQGYHVALPGPLAALAERAPLPPPMD